MQFKKEGTKVPERKGNVMKSRILFVPALLICIILLAGCWNYKEIDEMAIAVGMAIDKDKETDNYIITIEIVNQRSEKQGGKEEGTRTKSILVETKGYTLFDAGRNAIMKTGKKVFWGHCKAVIISKDIANEGIAPVLDLIWRDAETRPDIWIFISKEDTAGEILRAENESTETISFYLDNTINTAQAVPKFLAEKFVILMEQMSYETNSVVVPTVYTIVYDGKKIPEVQGSGVFKEDKLIYYLSGEECRIASLIKNKPNEGVITLNENDMRISIEMHKCNVQLNPVIENDHIVMQIDVRICAAIAELEGDENYIESGKREIISGDIENLLSEKIIGLIKKTQNSSTDIFDFNGTILRKLPDYWRIVEDSWDENYKKIEIICNIEAVLTLSGSMMQPMEIGE